MLSSAIICFEERDCYEMINKHVNIAATHSCSKIVGQRFHYSLSDAIVN